MRRGLLFFIIIVLSGCAYSMDNHSSIESEQESVTTLVSNFVSSKDSTPLNIEVGYSEEGVVTKQDIIRAGIDAGLCFENEDRHMDWEDIPYTVTIASGAIKLESGAFYKCGNVIGITIPDSMIELGTPIGNFNLRNITVASGNEVYKDIDGVVFSKSGDTILLYPKGRPSETYIIPDGTVTIGSDALGASKLTGIIIPDSVTEIATSAFYGCRDLTEIIIPDGVTIINDYTFRECTSLTEIILPANLEEIGREAFMGCVKLTTITIPSGVIRLGSWAFYECENLSVVQFTGTNHFDFNGKEEEPIFEGCSEDLTLYCPASDESWDKIELEGIPFVTEVFREHGSRSKEP